MNVTKFPSYMVDDPFSFASTNGWLDPSGCFHPMSRTNLGEGRVSYYPDQESWFKLRYGRWAIGCPFKMTKQQHGPYTAAQVREWVAQTPNAGEALVWMEGWSEWRRIAEVDEFAVDVPPTVAPNVATSQPPQKASDGFSSPRPDAQPLAEDKREALPLSAYEVVTTQEELRQHSMRGPILLFAYRPLGDGAVVRSSFEDEVLPKVAARLRSLGISVCWSNGGLFGLSPLAKHLAEMGVGTEGCFLFRLGHLVAYKKLGSAPSEQDYVRAAGEVVAQFTGEPEEIVMTAGEIKIIFAKKAAVSLADNERVSLWEDMSGAISLQGENVHLKGFWRVSAIGNFLGIGLMGSILIRPFFTKVRDEDIPCKSIERVVVGKKGSGETMYHLFQRRDGGLSEVHTFLVEVETDAAALEQLLKSVASQAQDVSVR